MGIRILKPITPGQRGMSVSTFEEVTTDKPEKSLVKGKKAISGRNSSGRTTVRRRGGGHKRRYRMVDFKRNKFDVPGKVATVEYDPNRSARVSLIHYADGEKRYILWPVGMSVGDEVISGQSVKVAVGNAMPMKHIPVGTTIHNIELSRGKGGQIVRSAGAQAQLVAREGKWCTVKLSSGEMRMVPGECFATIGQVGNIDHMNVKLGKAGRTRWLGRRPKVRGVVMNPVDHPHGGGEGKTSGGRHPVTPWGKPTKGYRTRKKKKVTGKFIVKSRHQRKKR